MYVIICNCLKWHPFYFRHQRTNNVIESYNQEFNGLFDSPKPGTSVFCECIKDEALHWEARHKYSLSGRFRHIHKRKEVRCPEVPDDFDEWFPKKKTKPTQKRMTWFVLDEESILKGETLFLDKFIFIDDVYKLTVLIFHITHVRWCFIVARWGICVVWEYLCI